MGAPLLSAPLLAPLTGTPISCLRPSNPPSQVEGAGGGGWSASLGQLSGGQRSLASLALLLAVARAGRRCSLFLMDEVDAALDEANQVNGARASPYL